MIFNTVSILFLLACVYWITEGKILNVEHVNAPQDNISRKALTVDDRDRANRNALPWTGREEWVVLLRCDNLEHNHPVLTGRWNSNASHIWMDLLAQTTGWMAFGISPDGGMDKSDVLFAWCDDTACYAQDRNIAVDQLRQRVNLTSDDQQDWQLISGRENGTHTWITATRRLNTMDNNDMRITGRAIHGIFAVGAVDPDITTGEIQKHMYKISRKLTVLPASHQNSLWSVDSSEQPGTYEAPSSVTASWSTRRNVSTISATGRRGENGSPNNWDSGLVRVQYASGQSTEGNRGRENAVSANADINGLGREWDTQSLQAWSGQEEGSRNSINSGRLTGSQPHGNSNSAVSSTSMSGTGIQGGSSSRNNANSGRLVGANFGGSTAAANVRPTLSVTGNPAQGGSVWSQSSGSQSGQSQATNGQFGQQSQLANGRFGQQSQSANGQFGQQSQLTNGRFGQQSQTANSETGHHSSSATASNGRGGTGSIVSQHISGGSGKPWSSGFGSRNDHSGSANEWSWGSTVENVLKDGSMSFAELLMRGLRSVANLVGWFSSLQIDPSTDFGLFGGKKSSEQSSNRHTQWSSSQESASALQESHNILSTNISFISQPIF